MPFVTPGHRKVPNDMIPGDRCYVHYRWMVDMWKKERRWTTADSIYARVAQATEGTQAEQRAKELAWQVFFILKVMPYEEEMMERNGDIE